MVKRKRGSRRALKYSFLGTSVVLALIVVGVIASSYNLPIPLRHLPATIPQYEAEWAKYVPDSVLQFSYQNMSFIHKLNSSLPFFNTILHIVTPSASLTTRDMEYFVSMLFNAPNASVDFAFLPQATYADFAAKFSGAPASDHVGSVPIYGVVDTATGKLRLGFLALVDADRAVAFSPGFAEALAGLKLALASPSKPEGSVAGLQGFREMLYVSGGDSGRIAVGLYNFNSEVADSMRTLISVFPDGALINVTRVVEFIDTQTARSDAPQVRRAYLSATHVVVYDSYVRASLLDHIGDLGGDYRLVQ